MTYFRVCDSKGATQIPDRAATRRALVDDRSGHLDVWIGLPREPICSSGSSSLSDVKNGRTTLRPRSSRLYH
jgi:hypothetical protein